MTKALAEFDAALKRSDVKILNNYIRLKASFEFNIQNHFIALHVSSCFYINNTVLMLNEPRLARV